MKKILVTGANKGIGLALVKEILLQQEDTFVFLGSRNQERGQQAHDRLLSEHPAFKNRCTVLDIDVSNMDSVHEASQVVRDDLENTQAALYGIVNNAGIGLGNFELMDVLQVNTYGIKRVCDAFLPLLEPNGGRIVNITSASGPNYVATCAKEQQELLTHPDVTWEQIDGYMTTCLELKNSGDSFKSKGMGDGNAYGISKACANAYTIALARSNPTLIVNACTPGFIETDLTMPYAQSRGVAPAEMGMKSPKEGTVSALHLLFDTPEGSGLYFGSDAKRSPLDRYRAPGSAPYTGD